MLMRAEIQVPDAKGSLIDGDYTLNWASPSHWREEIRFSNYERLRVYDTNGYWQRSSLSYQPEVIFQLDELLDLKEVLTVQSKQTLGDVKKRGKEGARQECTEVKSPQRTDRIMCFDETTGGLASVEYPKAERQNPPEISRIEYSAFNAVNGKLIPYETRAFRDKKLIAAAKILEITKTSQENQALFEPLQDGEYWRKCDDIQKAQIVNRVHPIYPTAARAHHEMGKVVIYAVIETNGSLSHLTIIHHAPGDLESAALDAVRQWRYKPSSCNGTPIRVETSVTVDFWVEQ